MAASFIATDEIEAAFRRGKLYDPAWAHYGKEGTVVTCDRCGASELTVCVGLDDTDICIKCIDALRALGDEAARSPTREEQVIEPYFTAPASAVQSPLAYQSSNAFLHDFCR